MDAHTNARQLNPDNPCKPLDFGNGLLAGSVAPDGRLLALNTYHPTHGHATLSASAPFPDDQRYDQAAVRAYRAALADPYAAGYGLSPTTGWEDTTVGLIEDVVPVSHLVSGPVRAQVITWAPLHQSEPVAGAVQVWHLENTAGQPVSWEYTWGGPLSLTRASMTQLTEGGGIPMPPPTMSATFDGDALFVHAPPLGVTVAILGLPPDQLFQRTGNAPLRVQVRGRLSLGPGERRTLTFAFAYGSTPAEARTRANRLFTGDLDARLAGMLDAWRGRWAPFDRDLPASVRLLAHRALSYILCCCALPVDEGLCLLTDHQILPLSWTRDAYYLVQALLARPDPEVLDLVRRHLVWLFEIAQRPDGYWERAYLANGRPKDRAFQLDQQCYPLLELAEYAGITGDEATVVRFLPHLPGILDAVLARRASDVALFGTEETPADDPLPLPWHFSSQVLLWHALRQLAALNGRWPFTSLDLAGLAQDIHVAIWEYLAAEHQGRRLFAYATDLQGTYRFYHDANDLPTVLAPLWGFCPADDPVWRATMDFAFSPANRGGYYPGRAGGLGSVHTPGAWPLGDVQELLYARLAGNIPRAQAVLHRLVTTACWDGALPEARDENSGAVRSRHWFAWAGAALLAALTHPAWQP